MKLKIGDKHDSDDKCIKLIVNLMGMDCEYNDTTFVKFKEQDLEKESFKEFFKYFLVAFHCGAYSRGGREKHDHIYEYDKNIYKHIKYDSDEWFDSDEDNVDKYDKNIIHEQAEFYIKIPYPGGPDFNAIVYHMSDFYFTYHDGGCTYDADVEIDEQMEKDVIHIISNIKHAFSPNKTRYTNISVAAAEKAKEVEKNRLYEY